MPDVRCMEDLDLFGRECETELDALEQDIVHRTIEKPGSNPDDPNRGLGLRDRLSGAVDPGFRSRAEHEYRNDPRVDAARATVTDDGEGKFALDVEIEASGETLGLSINQDGSQRSPT